MFGSVAATQTTSFGANNPPSNTPSWSQQPFHTSFATTMPTTSAPNFAPLSGNQSNTMNSLLQLPDIQSIKEAFNLQGPSCRFRYIFYNASSMAATINPQVPQGMDPALWEQIQKNNPDPSRLVPVQLSGFDELQTRMQQQSARIQEHLQALTGIERVLAECSDIEKTQCALKLTEFRNRYCTLFRRLVQFIGRVWCLLSRGRALRVEENQMKEALEALQKRMNSPGQLHDQLADLIELFRTSVSLENLNVGIVLWEIYLSSKSVLGYS